ncbi:MAG TPA: AAA family ATPase [Candidatus Acidoferrales bacterium]|nr:AAA family ATPase [Candidatus Acidoferrales bacterium]
MQLFVFFGLPGAGKTYAGKIAEKYFGYHLYDGDQDLTPEMLMAIKNKAVITDDMRDVFFKNLIQSVILLEENYKKVIVAQTFIKEKYREQFLYEFPYAKFVLIEADEHIREPRIKERKEYDLDIDYARKMTDLFGTPAIAHETVYNNAGEEEVKEQLQKLLV